MHIRPLPVALLDIRDDGRSICELLSTLERRHVALFARHLFEQASEPTPPSGTKYNFVAVVAKDLPLEARLNPERVFNAARSSHHGIHKVSLRSALFLMERMERERLWADIFVMSEPATDTDGPAFVIMGYEHEDGVPWIASVGGQHTFEHDNEVVLLASQDA